jgi:hypothetical protein
MDPRLDFISNVDINATRVKSFRGFVFMCGGPHDLNEPARSVRSLLIREMTSGRHSGLAERIKLAEEIQDWYSDATYTDLVQLEEHLASLSSLIVLVVESEGAIAELGVFSTIERFHGRLLTLVANTHYEIDSFIRLGPIRRLEKIDVERVLVYDWIGRDAQGREVKKFDDIAEDIVDAVRKVNAHLAAPSSEMIFKWDDPLHVMLLVCELCDLFGALALLEIENYLEKLGRKILVADLKRFLFLLEKCGLIARKANGNSRYFCAPSWKAHISFALGGNPVDRDRLRVDVFNYYKENDSRRASVVRSVVSHDN